MIKRISSILPDEIDTVFFLGLGSIFYGIFQIAPPYAYIVAGAILAVVSLLGARN